MHASACQTVSVNKIITFSSSTVFFSKINFKIFCSLFSGVLSYKMKMFGRSIHLCLIWFFYSDCNYSGFIFTWWALQLISKKPSSHWMLTQFSHASIDVLLLELRSRFFFNQHHIDFSLYCILFCVNVLFCIMAEKPETWHHDKIKDKHIRQKEESENKQEGGRVS